MKPFEEDGEVVILQVVNKLFRYSAGNDVGLHSEVGKKSRFPGIVTNRLTILVQLRGRFTFVFIAMEVNADPGLMQSPDLIKNINHATIIGGERDVEGDDMQAEHRKIEN